MSRKYFRTRRFIDLSNEEQGIVAVLVRRGERCNPRQDVIVTAVQEDMQGSIYIYTSETKADGGELLREIPISPQELRQAVWELVPPSSRKRGSVSLFGFARERPQESNTTVPAKRPPAAAVFLAFFIPKRHREEWLGDLEEQYADLYDLAGRKYARAWFFIQVMYSLPKFAWAGLKAKFKKEVEKRLKLL